jgi:hypothetical protein
MPEKRYINQPGAFLLLPVGTGDRGVAAERDLHHRRDRPDEERLIKANLRRRSMDLAKSLSNRFCRILGIRAAQGALRVRA